MYILAVDDENLALRSLVNELKKVFPGSEIHSERQPTAAIKWVQDLGESSDELRYAFLGQYRIIIVVQLRSQFSATYHIFLIAQVLFCAELVFRQIVQ